MKTFFHSFIVYEKVHILKAWFSSLSKLRAGGHFPGVLFFAKVNWKTADQLQIKTNSFSKSKININMRKDVLLKKINDTS